MSAVPPRPGKLGIEAARKNGDRLDCTFMVQFANHPIRKLAAALALGALVMSSTGCGAVKQIADLPKLKPWMLRLDNKPQTSKIFDGRGHLIRTFHGEENRTIVPLKRIPPRMRRAVIAIEDQRFFEHSGVDLHAIGRALVTNVTSGQIEQGGSTITQQYVKTAILARGKIAAQTLERKIDEAALARQIEKKLTKKQILERYLNTVYFGEGAYGVQTAARTYFGIPASRLSLSQAAMLAGIVRSPEAYDPLRHPKTAKKRRGLVLSKMRQLHYISPKEAHRAKKSRVVLQGADGERYPAPYFVDYVQRLIQYDPRFKALGSTLAAREKALYQGGLRIHTTVNLQMERQAERAIGGVLYEKSDPHASLVSIDPRSGRVKAMVGGRDWFAPAGQDKFSKFNLAITGGPHLGPGGTAPGTGRQAGSAFKPFALVAAIEQGIPLSKVYDAAPCMIFSGADAGGAWRVCNYEGESFSGPISLLLATIDSVNVVYAQLILEVGAQKVVDVAKDMGISSPLLAVNSAVLGTNTINPLDMASGYATLAASGIHHPPVAISKITGPHGKVLYKDRSRPTEAVPPGAAYIATSALEQVVAQGTGVAANIGRPQAGKTGTAQEYRDAWFVGFTPQLSTAVWVGYPEGEIEMNDYCTTSVGCRATRIGNVTGGSWPAMIWHNYMLGALADVPPTPFEVPQSGVITVTVDTRNGCLAGPYTPTDAQAEATFAPGTEPVQSCLEPGDLPPPPPPSPSPSTQPSPQPQPSPSRSAKPSPQPQRSPTPEPPASPSSPQPQPSPTKDGGQGGGNAKAAGHDKGKGKG